ncbi:hypothetical protein BO82DRAFT_349908 [Aspergillus uvarum CBS 121591]|uniref:Uncharacterized protein n=1 Tax=Aspergillus uvarum CBS 121591 TaxID=1448315 RepID=A0A319CMS9_9EURO|nr:hypothetical protein BO82DRAFT_349908 [Aspergillus uvarum CBS 121591]PYH86786.1 hypothetical protein BO82DRAFT_349908 [Aspergillus uvarum CBS 121591]
MHSLRGAVGPQRPIFVSAFFSPSSAVLLCTESDFVQHNKSSESPDHSQPPLLVCWGISLYEGIPSKVGKSS